jgi:hypothetical protein
MVTERDTQVSSKGVRAQRAALKTRAAQMLAGNFSLT